MFVKKPGLNTEVSMVLFSNFEVVPLTLRALQESVDLINQQSAMTLKTYIKGSFL